MPIPSPQLSLPAHQETLVALKEAVEVLLGERRVGELARKAVTQKELEELGYIPEAPHDGQLYGRRDGVWEVIPP